MANFKRKCEDCLDVLSTPTALKRHKLTCKGSFKETESEAEETPRENSEAESSSEDEVYLNEEDIDDLLKTFKPNTSSLLEEKANQPTSPFLKYLVLWTCLFLCLWQSVFYISSNAITVLLQFLHGLIEVAAQHYKALSVILPMFPSSIYMLKKLLKVDGNNFRHYVTCPKCYSLYSFADCVTVVEGEEVSKQCCFVSQPNHPKAHFRRPCGSSLLKTIILPSGKRQLIPIKNYFYKPVKDSLTDLVRRAGFTTKCEEWRDRETRDDTFCDVYDGKIWRHFEKDFFKTIGNYGLMLNLDWFQPYKHVTYSVGVIYLVVLNLPRHERFKRENIIIVGVIPHMSKEPPTNTFVQPLVDELVDAWDNGFSIKLGLKERLFRLALLCVGCDIPACRKLCGFIGHAGVKGCSRCKKSFPGGFGKRDYSGFDRNTWAPRSNEQHLREVRNVTKCNTKTARKDLESKLGTRYSVLTELPYFDIIRMSIIDPMHNLFLGTAKHMLHVWRDTGVISDSDLETIQRKVDKVDCPSDVGRIPMKIASGFASFTADQWKNWTMLFSIFCLKGVIPDEHLDCWRDFVMACRYLCSKILTKTDIKMADMFLVKFCKKFEALYGHERVTPNMHLHCHLAECVVDFGPVYSFWLFSFERCNGILGDYSTNNKNIELQLMRRFTCHTHILGVLTTNELEVPEPLKAIMDGLSTNAKAGTLSQINRTSAIVLRDYSSRLCQIDLADWTNIEMITYDKFKMRMISCFQETLLRRMYEMIYSDQVGDLSPVFKEVKSVRICEERYGSSISRDVKSAHIQAHWVDGEGQIDWGTRARPGTIKRFLDHSVTVAGQEKHHLLAEIDWFADLPDQLRGFCGAPVEAWEPSLFVRQGPASYMLIQRIKGKVVRMSGEIGNRDVMFVCPRDRFTECICV